MKKAFSTIFLLLAVACQPLGPTTSPPAPSLTAPVLFTSTPGLPTATAEVTPLSPTVTSAPQADKLAAFKVDFTRPFSETTRLIHWSEAPLGSEDIPLPVSLSKTANAPVTDGLTSPERVFLSTNGFVVIHSQEAQFGDIRKDVSDTHGQPYYLTTDAAYHALHLQFDELLKALERDQFSTMLVDITQATLNEVLSYLPQTRGTGLENDTIMAAAYLSVGLKLLIPEMSIDPSVAEIVTRQIDQIMAYAGRDKSILFSQFGGLFEDDYGAYRPVGHYAGVPELEQYFRAMTWYGRVNFRLADRSRVPVIITTALRRARVNVGPASDEWVDLHKVLTFLIGPSDDAGPLEYASLMDQVYGDASTVLDLVDKGRWNNFVTLGKTQLPAPQINSTFVDFMVNLPAEKGWRFMGQRFTMDEFIFQNLIYDKVAAMPDGARRNFPSGADVMGVLGSQAAQQVLAQMGAVKFPNYPDQFAMLQKSAQAQPEHQWLACSYCAWLYSFFPVLAPKGQAYPAYMRSAAWGYKDLNAALGSWTELKHDTILYTKMAEGAGGGGPPSSPPAPSYVEPNPEAFYRLAYLAGSLSDGLLPYLNQYPSRPGSSEQFSLFAGDFASGMHDLSERFTRLGQIAADELAGKPPPDDRWIITECLGMIECMNEKSPYNHTNSEMPKFPVVAAVSGAEDSVLEAGTGYVDRIYVVVPLENKWEIAQGGVYSYYEFIQPRGQRLTDDEWRAKLVGSPKPALPDWASNFLSLDGSPSTSDWILFRVGDAYNITTAGDHLYLYEEPSGTSKVVAELNAGDFVTIKDGPVVDGMTFWKFNREMCANYSPDCKSVTGWAVEQQDWYHRLPMP